MDKSLAEQLILQAVRNESALRMMIYSAVTNEEIPEEYRKRIIDKLTLMLNKTFNMTNKTLIDGGLTIGNALLYIASILQSFTELSSIADEINQFTEKDLDTDEIVKNVNKFIDELNKK